VSYSPDGKVLAVAGTRQCFVDLWDVPGLKRIKFLQPDEGRLVAFSPRGDLLATDAEKQIRVWRTGTWELAGTLPIPGYVAALKFSADGRRLASLGYPGKITVWETDQWTVIREISGVMSTGWQGVLDFSPDGKAVVLGCFDRHIRVFNLANGNTDVNIPEAHSELITAVAWSPTGSVIASGSGYNGGPIQLWDATTGTRVRELEGHTGWMCQLVFSKDGQRLYSAAGDHTIRIWDVEKRRPPAILRGSTHEVYGIALSPDGRTLASACKDGVVAFWSAEPKPEVELPRIAMGGLPAFSPDSRFLAVPRKEGTVSLFNLATLREDEQIPALDTSGVHMVTYSPKGDLLIIGTREGKIGVWSCAEHRLLCQPPGHNVSIFGFHYRADGTQLLSVDIEGKAILWDTLTWQRVRFFTVPDVGVGDVSSDLRLGAVSAGGDLRWFDETGTRLDKKRGHLHPINRVTFSDDDSRVATTSSDGTVALWDPSSFEQIRMFRGHMQGAHGVAFSPDGRRLATAGGAGHEAIKLWDLSTDLSAQPPRELITLPGKGSLFAWVLFSPDGQWLAAICQTEATFDLWRAPSWAEIEAAEEKLKSGQSL
jgi:WD40 repeat protein